MADTHDYGADARYGNGPYMPASKMSRYDIENELECFYRQPPTLDFIFEYGNEMSRIGALRRELALRDARDRMILHFAHLPWSEREEASCPSA